MKVSLIAKLRTLRYEAWQLRRVWHCKIIHWRCRKPVFGGYPFPGRTDRQTGVHCSKCHTTRPVRDWQKAVVVKTDSQIEAEIKTFGREQLTPEKYWRNGKWA